MALEIYPIDPAPLGIRFPAVLYGGFQGSDVLGVGGLVWAHERCWLVLGFVDETSRHPVYVVRWAQRMLRKAQQLGETAVYSWRDETKPQAKRLLELVGMTCIGHETVSFWDGSTGEHEVWKWQTPQLSLSSPQLERSPLPA